MLVLSRKKNQSVVLEGVDKDPLNKIEIIVLDIQGDRVRLGIEAPASVSIYRHEVYGAVQREKLASGGEGHHDL